MTHKILLFVIPGMEVNSQALKAIKRLPNTQVEEVPCPDSMKEWFDLPFARDENGIAYYGLEGITSFVSQLSPRAQTHMNGKAATNNG